MNLKEEYDKTFQRGYLNAITDVLQLLQDEPLTTSSRVGQVPTFNPIAAGRNKLRQDLREKLKELGK